MSNSPLHNLSELGQSVWIDSLSREMMDRGELQPPVEGGGGVGGTPNPSLSQKAPDSESYDGEMRELMDGETDEKEVFFNLAVTDVRRACDILRPVWDEGSGRHGWVSLEVEPDIASDTG